MANQPNPKQAAIDAAAKWAAMPMRSQRSLAPWDEFEYFDLPTTTLYVITSGNLIQIAAQQPRRVVLIIHNSSTNPALVQPATAGNTNAGLWVSQNNNPLIITQASHGILCQVAWQAPQAIGSGPIHVTEVTLREWSRKIARR